jgi:alpha-D-ribose 1-methylphosphonate 5-triphosphate synthase subunit PhnG
MPRSDPSQSDSRRERMHVLACAPYSLLQFLCAKLQIDDQGAQLIRGPETGLVTIRGRIGGAGAAFNVGEATVTRASVRLSSGEIGHSYQLGRDAAKARLCAIIDAAAQRPGNSERVEQIVIAPLRARLGREDARKKAEAAATKVDFFTMVRGED